MKRRIGRRKACLLFAGTLAATACAAPTQTSTPAVKPAVDPKQPGGLAVAAPVVDLGRVPFNKQVEASYELVNTGSTPIALRGRAKVSMLEGC